MQHDITRTQTLLIGTAIIASIATSGSLWFSIGLGLVPCTLCWYQRILMYPLVIVLGIAAFEDRIKVYRTALPLSILGSGIAAYHSYIQLTAGSCTLNGPCGAIQYQLPILGLTIPNMALVAFTLISSLLLIPVYIDLSEISVIDKFAKKWN